MLQGGVWIETANGTEKEITEQYRKRTGLGAKFETFQGIVGLSFLITFFFVVSAVVHMCVMTFIELTAISLDVINTDELTSIGMVEIIGEPVLLLPFFLAGLAIITLTFSTIISYIDGIFSMNKTKPVRLEEGQIEKLRLFLENLDEMASVDDNSEAEEE